MPNDHSATQPSTTAYADEARWLRAWLLRGQPDAVSFQRPLPRCALRDCQGMCCYAGVGVRKRTAEELCRLARGEAGFFRGLGLALPDPPVVKKGFWPVTIHTTHVRPHPFSSLVPGFPGHFRDTACVFMVEDGRCGLQTLSQHQGLHPWHFKPIACVLQPIKLGTAPGVSLILPDEQTDPSRRPGYPGYATATRCGARYAAGPPAAETLRPELAWLQEITGVNLLWAVAPTAPPAGRGPPPDRAG